MEKSSAIREDSCSMKLRIMRLFIELTHQNKWVLCNTLTPPPPKKKKKKKKTQKNTKKLETT